MEESFECDPLKTGGHRVSRSAGYCSVRRSLESYRTKVFAEGKWRQCGSARKSALVAGTPPRFFVAESGDGVAPQKWKKEETRRTRTGTSQPCCAVVHHGRANEANEEPAEGAMR